MILDVRLAWNLPWHGMACGGLALGVWAEIYADCSVYAVTIGGTETGALRLGEVCAVWAQIEPYCCFSWINRCNATAIRQYLSMGTWAARAILLDMFFREGWHNVIQG